MADKYQYEISVDVESLDRLEKAADNVIKIVRDLDDDTLKILADHNAKIQSSGSFDTDALLTKLTDFMEQNIVKQSSLVQIPLAQKFNDDNLTMSMDSVRDDLKMMMDTIKDQFRKNKENMALLGDTIKSNFEMVIDENTTVESIIKKIESIEGNDDLKVKLLEVLDADNGLQKFADMQTLLGELKEFKTLISVLLNTNVDNEMKTEELKQLAQNILDKVQDEQTRKLIDRALSTNENITEPESIISKKKITNMGNRLTRIQDLNKTIEDVTKIIDKIDALVPQDVSIENFSTKLDEAKKILGIAEKPREKLTSSYLTETYDAFAEAALQFRAQFSKMDKKMIESVNKALADLDVSIFGNEFNEGDVSVDKLFLEVKQNLLDKIEELKNKKEKTTKLLGKPNSASMINAREIMEDTFKQIEQQYYNLGLLDITTVKGNDETYIDNAQTFRKLDRLQGMDKTHKSFKRAMDAIMSGFTGVLEKGSENQKNRLLELMKDQEMELFQKVAISISGVDWTKDIKPALENFGVGKKGGSFSSEIESDKFNQFLTELENNISPSSMTDIFRDKLSKFNVDWFTKIASGIDEELDVSKRVDDIRSKLDTTISEMNDAIMQVISEQIGLNSLDTQSILADEFADIIKDMNKAVKNINKIPKASSAFLNNIPSSSSLSTTTNATNTGNSGKNFDERLKRIVMKNFMEIGSDLEGVFPKIQKQYIDALGSNSDLFKDVYNLVKDQFKSIKKESAKSMKKMDAVNMSFKDLEQKIQEFIQKLEIKNNDRI